MNHHPNSPSSLKRRSLCPASMTAEVGLPDTTSDVADRGTAIHKAVETGVCPSDFTASEQETVAHTIEVIERLTEGAISVTHEKKLRLFVGNGEIITYGYCDVFAEFEDNVLVIEEKHGFLAVDDEIDNIQTACYACMAMQLTGKSKCKVVIINPSQNKWGEDSFTFTDQKALQDNIEAIIKRCHNEPNTLNPGVQQCKYCKCAFHGTCKAYKDWALSSLEVAEKKPLTHGDAGKLISRYLDKLSEMNKMMDRAKSMVIARWRETGERPANVTIKEVTNGHTAKDVMGLYNNHKEDITQEEFLKLCKPSVSDIRDLTIKKKGSRTEKGNLKRGEKERLTKSFYEACGNTIEPRPKKVYVKIVEEKLLL